MPQRGEREQDLHPVPANETRARLIGGFKLRESLLVKMGQGVEAGLAFPDAAQAAGIPYELVLASLSYDDDMRAWYRQCSGRKSLIRAEDAQLLPTAKSSMEHKKDTLDLVFAAGLGRKLAEAVAHIEVIDPETGDFNKEHMNVLFAFNKNFMGLLPKESEGIHRDAPPDEAPPRTEEIVARELLELREKRLAGEAAEKTALETRRTGGRSLTGPKRDSS